MEPLKLLRKLGLNDYEARAYLSLAKLGPSTVREVVLDSQLPRNKTYESLQNLEQKNKVISLPVSPRKYSIINPGVFKDEVIELSKSVDSLIELIEEPKTTNFKDIFWVIKGRKMLIEKFAEVNNKAKKEILSISELNRILYKNMDIIKQAVKRGVRVKFITKFDKKNMPCYKAWTDVGAEIRVFNENKFGYLLPRIAVQDGEIARITVGKPEVSTEEEYITLWTESRAFAHMLKTYFISVWKNSEPIEKYLRPNRKP